MTAPADSSNFPAAARSWNAFVEQLDSGWVRAKGPLVYGLRLWISVTATLYVAFWLEMDAPYWAATSAAVACLPQVGASLRRGWFRLIGTLVGATAGFLLAATFSQDRALFFLALALWGAASAFATTILTNYASYGAALSGYTAAIVAGGALGATGGVHADVAFQLAVARASEIALGIVCAGVIRTLTDRGDAPRRLAASIATLSTDIARGFLATLSNGGAGFHAMQPVRREFARRAITLDPVIDQALGESSEIRYRSPVLQRALDGLFTALVGWRAVGTHLNRLRGEEAREDAAFIRTRIGDANPAALADPAQWRADPQALRRGCEAAIRDLESLEARSPSIRLLADKTAELLGGMAQALGGQALLVDPAQPGRQGGRKRLRVPDVLPALVNAARVFLTILALVAFWIATAWPSGVTALIFAMVIAIAQGPRANQAYGSAVAFGLGVIAATCVTTFISLAILPRLPASFAALALLAGCVLVPLGAFGQIVRNPTYAAIAGTTTTLFIPFLQPTNPMVYNAADTFNRSLAIMAGCLAGALSFRLLPPLSPAYRTQRLLRLTLRDLRGLAGDDARDDWRGHVLGRLVSLPDTATPLQRAQLVAALSVGEEIVRLRSFADRLGLTPALAPALGAIAGGAGDEAARRLEDLDATLAAMQEPAETRQTVLRARASVLVLSEALVEHAAYFNDGAAP
ncbi:MAG TPA: FUSC family protein [Rhodoblastus sp.]|nr:FUSC family protein [Rhodoblastus sp.]